MKSYIIQTNKIKILSLIIEFYRKVFRINEKYKNHTDKYVNYIPIKIEMATVFVKIYIIVHQITLD